MRLLLVVLSIVSMTLLAATPAQSAMSDMCTHAPTIASLRDCVALTADTGATNQGATKSLLVKLDAAQADLDRSTTGAASSILQAFIKEVQAQSGKGIAVEHADHMVQHAEDVLAALSS